MKLDYRIFIAIIGTIILYAIFLMFSDFSQVYGNIINFNILYIPIILGLVPIGWLMLFFRWHLMLRNSGIELPLKKNFLIYLSGFALSVTPGKLGELLKSQIIKSNFGTPRTSTAPLILVERLYNLIGMISIAFFGLLYFEISSYIIIISAILVITGFTIISSEKLFIKSLKIFEKIKFTAKLITPLQDSYKIVRKSTRGPIVVYCSGLSITAWLIELLAVYFVFLGFGIFDLSYFQIVQVYTASIFLGAASLLPEGIGVVEGSLIGLLSVHGVEISTAPTLVIVIRILTLWYGVIAGLVCLKATGVFSTPKNNESLS